MGSAYGSVAGQRQVEFHLVGHPGRPEIDLADGVVVFRAGDGQWSFDSLATQQSAEVAAGVRVIGNLAGICPE